MFLYIITKIQNKSYNNSANPQCPTWNPPLCFVIWSNMLPRGIYQKVTSKFEESCCCYFRHIPGKDVKYSP